MGMAVVISLFWLTIGSFLVLRLFASCAVEKCVIRWRKWAGTLYQRCLHADLCFEAVVPVAILSA